MYFCVFSAFILSGWIWILVTTPSTSFLLTRAQFLLYLWSGHKFLWHKVHFDSISLPMCHLCCLLHNIHIQKSCELWFKFLEVFLLVVVQVYGHKKFSSFKLIFLHKITSSRLWNFMLKVALIYWTVKIVFLSRTYLSSTCCILRISFFISFYSHG